MEISEDMIKKSCSQTIYKRGIEYYKQGRVHLKNRDENAVTAIVDGDRIYNVNIKMKDGALSEYFCTCPYYETMDCVCKHIVAVMKQRQAELEKSDFEDDNRHLAGELWNTFSCMDEKKEKLHLGISLTIQNMTTGTNIYNVALKINLKAMQNPETFLDCYALGKVYHVHSRAVYDPAKHYFGERETQMIEILVEAYQSRAAQSPYYVKSSGEIHIGSQTMKRLFTVLEGTDYDITFNRVHMGRAVILKQNPDVLVDVLATDDEITLYSDNYGVAVVPDGSIFFYEEMLYLPDEEWRGWFMPIYKSLSKDTRTRLSFRGENAIGFAAYILPKLKGRHGVTTEGIEDKIIHTKPKFSAYLDRRGNSIICTLKAAYGDISIKLPEGEAVNHKIVVRDQKEEEELLECVKNFEYRDGYYTLEQDDDIFEFITNGVYELKHKAEIFCSDRFSHIRINSYIPIKTTISRRYDVNLLEADFESDLTTQEMAGILSAVRLKKKYYRAANGEFYDIAGNLKAMIPLESIYPGEGSSTLLPVYNLLYLSAAEKDPEFQGIALNEDVKNIVEGLKDIRAVIPQHLEHILRTYQKEGLNWMAQLVSMGLGGILADDMGLGKTLQTLAFVWGQKPEKPVFVVTPSSLTYNWLREAEKFLPQAKVLIVEGSAAEREALIRKAQSYDFIITSYPILRRDVKIYENIEFSYMFIDEAQNIKNPKTMNARAVKKIHAQYHFALTGTPVENSLSELWSIFDFVMPGYLRSLRDFKEWFEVPIMKEGDSEAMAELRLKIKPFILRRMKQDVLSELPEKFEDTIYADLTPEQKKVYASYQETAKNEALSIFAEEGQSGKIQVLTLLLRLRQICCHPALFDADYKKDSGKMKVLEELTVSAVESGHRILIFSQFTSMLNIIQQKFTQKGISFFYLDGSTPPQTRSSMTERFNEGERSVFLISLRAGGAGLNLTGADMVIHYDPWWNPAVMDQASDRAHRIGQTRSVQVIRLASKGTIEENILKLQEKKRSLADDIITANNTSLQSLSTEEIISLFE